MRKFLLMSGLMLGFVVHSIAQATDNDFVVVGEVSSDLNMLQVKMRYAERPNVCFIQETKMNAIDQITTALEGHSCEDMHLFLLSTSTTLIFNSLVIASGNMDLFSESMVKWKDSVSGKVFIHCTVSLDDQAGVTIKQAFEKLTGLEFILAK